MNRRRIPLMLLFAAFLALVLVACNLGGEPELGTEENPIVMSFVPSGDTQDIIASGDQLAAMINERTGLVIESNVGTDFAAVRGHVCRSGPHWLVKYLQLCHGE